MKYGLPGIGPLERALHLRSLTIFRDLGTEELAACAQLTQERYLRRHEVLYREGQPIRALYLLIDGSVRLEHQGRHLRHLEAAADLGLIELLAGQPHRFRAVADSNAVALVIEGAALMDLVEEHFALFLQIRHALGVEVAQQQHALGSFHMLSAPPVPAVAAPSAPGNGVDASRQPSSDLAEVLLALQRTTVLRDVGLAHLAALTSEDQQLCLKPGEALWTRGADPTFMVLVTDGVVSCVPERTDLTFRAGVGTLLGVDAAFGGTPYAYDATAETSVTCRVMQTQMLLDLAEDHFDLAERVLAHSAGELLRLKALAAGDAPATQEEVAS